MVCCPYGQVTDEPSCDAEGGIKADESVNAKEIFNNFLHGRTKEECGKRILLDENSILRISEGKEAAPGDWPWMALLGYARQGKTGPSFECGGTLISLKTVLTSAHCLDKRFL